MFDAHRHLPGPGESLPSKTHSIWFATASPSEWEAARRMQRNESWRFGYGALPSHLVADRSFESIAESLAGELAHDRSAYVGEFGIDERYQALVPLDSQIALAGLLLQVASAQTRIAVMHHVGSFTILEQVLKSVDLRCPVIIHGFSGSVESARRLGDLGATVSLGQRLYTSRTKLQGRLKELDVPFVLETDFPHVDDGTDYGETLAHHYGRIAEILEIDVGELMGRMDGIATLLAHSTFAR